MPIDSPSRLPDFSGKHPPTAALKNVLAELGVLAPHTSEPYSEEMLLGIGGGIGAGYMLFQYEGTDPMVMVGARHLWHSDNVEFLRRTCSRLALESDILETRSLKAAEANLRRALDRGIPVIAWLDLASLPYFPTPQRLKGGMYHQLAVLAVDPGSGEALLADRAPSALRVPWHQLTEARAIIKTYKNRIMMVEPSTNEADLNDALRNGIRDCWQGLLHPRMKSFGLPSIQSWAELVADPKDKRGWPNVLADSMHLYGALIWVHHWIETAGTGGGALRPMYADFLDHASDLLNQPGLKTVADEYREAGRAWSALAVAVLPDQVPLLKESRELSRKMLSLFEIRGTDALPEIRNAAKRMSSIESEIAASFPLTPADVSDLLASIRDHIRRVYDLEMPAAQELQKTVP